MAEVLVTFKVMPNGVDTDLEEVSGEIKKISIAKLNNIEKEPIAFGLVALKPSFVAEDTGKVTDEIEAALKDIKGVGGAEVTEVTRLL